MTEQNKLPGDASFSHWFEMVAREEARQAASNPAKGKARKETDAGKNRKKKGNG